MSAKRTMGGNDRSRRKVSLMKRDGNRCRWCGKSHGPLTVDHIVPLARGGTNALSNLQLLCQSCNARKGDL